MTHQMNSIKFSQSFYLSQLHMQKIFTGLFGLFWGGICYEAGRVSQRQQKQDFSSDQVEIEHPELKGIAQLQQQTLEKPPQAQDTFVDDLIQAPFRTVTYPHFKILYSTYHKCPLAVHEKFTKDLADGDAPRRSTFFTEKSIEQQFQSTNDHFIRPGAYKNFNLARGHMAAAGNYSGNKQAKWMTFTYANVIPQNQYNNGGIWNTFERYSRDLVMNGKCDSVEVISGPIYFKGNEYQAENGEKYDKVYQEKSMVLMENGMMVPQKLYKIVKCNTKVGEQYLDAFEFWNKKTFDNDKPLKNFLTTVKKVQSQTGLKFNFAKDTVGNPVPLRSLVDLDKEGFEKNKRVYDQKFYTKLITNATTIDDMNNALLRAKDQQIHVPLDQFTQQTQKLLTQDVESIKSNYLKNQSKVACQTLKKLIQLNKNLYYLRQLTPEYEQEIQHLQESGPLEQCHQKANTLRSKKWQDFSQDSELAVGEKQEKISLNSLTHAITRALNKQEEAAQLRAAPVEEVQVLKYVNEERLKKFVIGVNTAVEISEENKKVQPTSK